MIEPTEIIAGAAAGKAIEKTIELVYKASRRYFKRIIKIDYSKSVSYLEYMDQWKQFLLTKSGSNKIVTNAWAFASREGFYEYERYIFRNMPTLYKTVSDAEQLIRDRLVQKTKNTGGIGGFVLYGYGNAYREANFIEKCISPRVEPTVIMYDCSPVYHGLALSHFNPLKKVMGIRNIEVYLVDIENRVEHTDFIVARRNKMPGNLPVLHIFMGNYACNLEEEDFKAILKGYTKEGDYIIFDHALYDETFFNNTENDYTCDLAKHAIAEIFSVPLGGISANIVVEKKEDISRKYVEVSFSYNLRDIKFKSMLRRNFISEVIYRDSFDQIFDKNDSTNNIRYILYLRTRGNNQNT